MRKAAPCASQPPLRQLAVGVNETDNISACRQRTPIAGMAEAALFLMNNDTSQLPGERRRLISAAIINHDDLAGLLLLRLDRSNAVLDERFFIERRDNKRKAQGTWARGRVTSMNMGCKHPAEQPAMSVGVARWHAPVHRA